MRSTPVGSWTRPLGAPAAQRRPVRVAVAGSGVVGNALVDLLQQQTRANGHAPRVELVRVLIRNPPRRGQVALDPELVTRSLDEFLATPSDVVVDAIGATERSERLAVAVLSTRRRYVTANRALVAQCGPDLVELAEHHGSAVDFGAALGGCLPAVRLLRDGAVGLGVQGVRAAFALDGSVARSLCAASERLSILSWLAFGADPRQLTIRQRGASARLPALEAVAATVGGAVRVLAEAIETPKGLVAAAEPAIVPTSSGEQLIVIESRSAGPISLSGGVDGVGATASLLYADVLRGATTLLPPHSRPAAAEDLRTHWWLILGRPAGVDVVASFCRAHEIEQAEVAQQPSAVERLVGVRASVGKIGELLTRLAGRNPSVEVVRWAGEGESTV